LRMEWWLCGHRRSIWCIWQRTKAFECMFNYPANFWIWSYIYNISHLCIWPVQLRHLFFLTTTMYMVASAVWAPRNVPLWYCNGSIYLVLI
jgi:hypothetical protein